MFFNKYFTQRSTNPLIYNFGAAGGGERTIQDIFRNIRAISGLPLDEAKSINKYVITDGERADSISLKLYGSTQYYWTFFVINNETLFRRGLNDWPRSNFELNHDITTTYDRYSVVSFMPVIDASNNYHNYLTGFPFETCPIPLYLIQSRFVAGAEGLPITLIHQFPYLDERFNDKIIKIEGWDSSRSQMFIKNNKIIGSSTFYDLRENPRFWISPGIEFINTNHEVDSATFIDVSTELYRWIVDELAPWFFRVYNIDYTPVDATLKSVKQSLNKILVESSFFASSIDRIASNALYKSAQYKSPIIIDDRSLTRGVYDSAFSPVDLRTNDFQTYREHITQQNEINRTISVIKPEFISAFSEAVKKILWRSHQ